MQPRPDPVYDPLGYQMAMKRLAAGQLSQGNIDLSQRKPTLLPTGDYATIRSMSFSDKPNQEILIPTIGPKGQQFTDNQAINEYYQTGKNLGTFTNPSAANSYAEALHRREANRIRLQGYGRPYPNLVDNAAASRKLK
jgi:hypothetical protein